LKTLSRLVLALKLWDKKDVILKNKAEKLLKTNYGGQKTNPNKAKNKAEKLLKTSSCGKNKPKNKPGHVVENTRGLKNEPKTNPKRTEAFPEARMVADCAASFKTDNFIAGSNSILTALLSHRINTSVWG
jgi:hypothetical protein